MSQFNNNIKLWMATGRVGEEKRCYPAFAGLSEEKAIKRLIEKQMYPNRYDFPIARIYVNSKLKHIFIQGVEVDSVEHEKRWYGKEISDFKLKLILLGTNISIGAFYSNSFLGKKEQFYALIEEYCKRKYKNKFSSALIFDISGEEEKIAAKITYSKKEYKIYNSENKITEYDKLYTQ